MIFFMIVDDPLIAAFVCKNGVDRLFVDLETLGKQERQGHLATWKSQQTVLDVSKIREAAPDAHLLVRVNPLNENSPSEIDEVIARGADSVMLPMFQSADEAAQFLEMVKGRAIALPLVETSAALAAVPEMVKNLPIAELHFGLNDLHLDLKLDFMFEPLCNGVLEEACATLVEAEIPFGIGGIAKAGEGIVSPEFLLGEHVRLGSNRTILSRGFHENAKNLPALKATIDIASETQKIRDIYAKFLDATPQELVENKIETARRINLVAQKIRGKI